MEQPETLRNRVNTKINSLEKFIKEDDMEDFWTQTYEIRELIDYLERSHTDDMEGLIQDIEDIVKRHT